MFTGNFTVPKPSVSREEIWYAAVALVALLMLASFFYSKNIVLYRRRRSVGKEGAPFRKDKKDHTMLESDAKYAEELQLQEVLLASQNSTPRSSLGSLLKRVMCEICLENHKPSQMFKNSTCSHTFCYDCTAKHATTKIQAKNKTIKCPGINCTSTLDSNKLRRIIPKQTLIKWDEYLCESTIPESQKLYCPYSNCSVLLINDGTRNSVTKVDCPVCRRSFCKVCKVPWHSELSCKKFGKLISKKGDEMAVALAKKKKWMKCPNCKFFVEKVHGCTRITCRCKYEFCYACGVKWETKHYRCRR